MMQRRFISHARSQRDVTYTRKQQVAGDWLACTGYKRPSISYLASRWRHAETMSHQNAATRYQSPMPTIIVISQSTKLLCQSPARLRCAVVEWDGRYVSAVHTSRVHRFIFQPSMRLKFTPVFTAVFIAK